MKTSSYPVRSAEQTRFSPKLVKKLLTLTLVLLLSLSIVGCGSKTEPAFIDMLPASEEKADYLNFQDARYGMSVAETCKALLLEQDKLAITEISTVRLPFLPDGYTAYSYLDYEYAEQKCELVLVFTEKAKLFEISLIFDDETKHNAATEHIIKELGSEPIGFDVNAKIKGYKSKKLVSDVLSEEQAIAFGAEMAQRELDYDASQRPEGEIMPEKRKESLLKSLSKDYRQKELAKINITSVGVDKNIIRFSDVGYSMVNSFLAKSK